MRLSFVCTLLLPALCSPIPAISQTSGPSATTITIGTPGDGRVAEWMYGEHIPAIPGNPFFAKVELDQVNQLQDGTLITHKTYNLDARDSLGRTRNEARNWSNPAAADPEPRLIRIEFYDPPTRTRTNVFPLTKTARQWIVPAPALPATPAAQNPLKPETSKEDLGSDTIEGLPVKGVRVNQIYPTGALGNDRPLTIATEYWYSEELKINLLTKRTDPRHGVQTVRVTNLVREEPDPFLFTIPAEYRLFKDALQPPPASGSGVAEDNPSTEQGIARAGVNGVKPPHCIYCPNPDYSAEARAAKLEGRVILSLVVTDTGQAERVVALRGPGHGLEQKAVEAVQNWRFEPATGPDGKPVTCSVNVEVSFRIR